MTWNRNVKIIREILSQLDFMNFIRYCIVLEPSLILHGSSMEEGPTSRTCFIYPFSRHSRQIVCYELDQTAPLSDQAFVIKIDFSYYYLVY